MQEDQAPNLTTEQSVMDNAVELGPLFSYKGLRNTYRILCAIIFGTCIIRTICLLYSYHFNLSSTVFFTWLVYDFHEALSLLLILTASLKNNASIVTGIIVNYACYPVYFLLFFGLIVFSYGLESTLYPNDKEGLNSMIMTAIFGIIEAVIILAIQILFGILLHRRKNINN